MRSYCRLSTFLLIILIVLEVPWVAQAYMTSDWDMSMGVSNLNYTYDGRVQETVESTSLIEMSYNLNSSMLQSALNLSFSEMTSGNSLQLPFTRIALGGRFYFAGINGKKIVYDSGSYGKIWRPTPFVGANIGLSNLSSQYINASFIDINMRGGVEVPITSNILLIGQISLGLGKESGGESSKVVNYESFYLMAGLRFAEFD